jgi:hypothetical protein
MHIGLNVILFNHRHHINSTPIKIILICVAGPMVAKASAVLTVVCRNHQGDQFGYLKAD